jgi:hypothetical protein
MTVAELIAQLNAYPSDTKIVLSKDAEGNSFSPLADLEDGRYFTDTTWSGEFVAEESWSEYVDDYDEEREFIKAICLWPIN